MPGSRVRVTPFPPTNQSVAFELGAQEIRVGLYTTQFAYKALRELYQSENRPVEAASLAAKIKD